MIPVRLKDLARQEEHEARFLGGHSLCRGCGIPAVVRAILNSIPIPVVVVGATGCLEVATTRYPTTAWNVPWLHIAFENAAAAMSGVERAYRALRRRGTLPEGRLAFVVFAGDGGTYDIGLQSLSGALDRGHHLLYVCYDNEAYMNTGGERSGATPLGARTTTTPPGALSLGNTRRRKDLTAIMVAHHIPYVAQASVSDLPDLAAKARHAVAVDGPSFLNVLTTCPLGWGTEPEEMVAVAHLAVETRYWPLFEVVEGHYRITYTPRARKPIEDWLFAQGRFRHLSDHPEVVRAIQEDVDEEWERLVAQSERDAPYFAALAQRAAEGALPPVASRPHRGPETP